LGGKEVSSSGDSQRQRRLLPVAGVQAGARGTGPDASVDQAALPGGERLGGAQQSNLARSPGGNGVHQPTRSRGGISTNHRLVQRPAVAQRLRVLAAGRLLPGTAGGVARSAADEAGAGASPPSGKQSEVTPTNLTLGRRSPRPLIPKRFVPLRMKHFTDLHRLAKS